MQWVPTDTLVQRHTAGSPPMKGKSHPTNDVTLAHGGDNNPSASFDQDANRNGALAHWRIGALAHWRIGA